MTTDPRGRWFRVYARQVRQHPKFRDLNVTQLGAWLVLRAEAELRDGECFTDRAEALLILRRRHTPRPAGMLDGLVALTLFDVLEDGRITVHDRADHDRQPYPSDDPEKVRERVRRHRSKDSGNESGNDHETTGNESGNESPRAHAHSGAVAGADSESVSVGNDAGARDEDDELLSDSVVAYHSMTGKYPKAGVIKWLNQLSDDHPEEAIVQVMADEYRKDDDVSTLIGRTETALKLDSHRREKRDKKAQADYLANLNAPHIKREREATPEEREQAKLQQQAIRIGLSMGVEVPTDPAEVRKFVMKHGSAA